MFHISFGFEPAVSDGVKDLCDDMIYNPENWEQQQYHFSHKIHKDLMIWTASGIPFIRLEGNKTFTKEEQRYISRAIKQSIANRVKGIKKV